MCSLLIVCLSIWISSADELTMFNLLLMDSVNPKHSKHLFDRLENVFNVHNSISRFAAHFSLMFVHFCLTPMFIVTSNEWKSGDQMQIAIIVCECTWWMEIKRLKDGPRILKHIHIRPRSSLYVDVLDGCGDEVINKLIFNAYFHYNFIQIEIGFSWMRLHSNRVTVLFEKKSANIFPFKRPPLPCKTRFFSSNLFFFLYLPTSLAKKIDALTILHFA